MPGGCIPSGEDTTKPIDWGKITLQDIQPIQDQDGAAWQRDPLTPYSGRDPDQPALRKGGFEIKVILVLIAIGLIVMFAWNSILDLIGRGENEDASASAMRFTHAARQSEVIPPQLQPNRRERPASRHEMTGEDCRSEHTTDYSRTPFTGTVMRVTDGDTIHANVQGVTVLVRLWGIDAPELDQPAGVRARDYLASLIPKDSKVEIYPVETDRYGRIVAVIGPKDGWSTNMMMVAYGWAYHLDEGLSWGHICLEEAQKLAQFQRWGVW